MKIESIWHQAKSEYAYAYDKHKLHIILRTAKNDFDNVSIIYGDPFLWILDEEKNPKWQHNITQMTKRYQTHDFDYYFIEIMPPYYRTKYAFILKKDNVSYLHGCRMTYQLTNDNALFKTYDLSEYYNFPYINDEDLHHTPDWVKDTIWYQIFPDRFFNKNNASKLKWGKLPVSNHEFYGGNLLGVIEKLPYLKDLGITGIYFTPIFKASSAHKYDTIDYFQIDPQFGSNEDFHLLVKKAHQLGIRIMLDGVFNHAGFHHPFFQDVIKNNEHSIYKNAFFIKQFPVINGSLDEHLSKKNYFNHQLNYETFAFTPYMPKWNTSDPIVENHLLSCIQYWIEKYDIDGWRLDVSNEISHDFLRKIKKVSRKAKKDTFILGENWDSSIPWLKGDQLDSVMNYDLAHPLWRFLEHEISLDTFKNLVTEYLAQTPKNVMENMFNLVGTHDTVRIKRRLNDDPRRVKLSYLFMFLSSGAPNIYYGDEIGLTGNHDPDNRRCMIWDSSKQDHDFYLFTKKLIKLRKSYDSFKSYDYHFIDSNILCFTKTSIKDDLLVLMNNSEEKISLTIDPNFYGDYFDLINLKTVTIHDKMKIDGYEFYILTKEVKS